jgi:hypothetical protein
MSVSAIYEKITTLKQRVNHERCAHVQAFVQGKCKIGKVPEALIHGNFCSDS